MIFKQESSIKYLQFEHLLSHPDIIHFSSTRIGGKSTGKLESLNLGYTVNDNPMNVTSNLESLAHVFGFNKVQMVSPQQTHSKNIGIVKSTDEIYNDTDALITNKAGICIFIRTADCVPVLLYDPVKNAVAAIHSGWKSTIQEISKHTIELMNKEYGTNPNDLIAGIGPSIGPAVYEVGPEVLEQFEIKFGRDHIITPIKESDKGYLNLWEVNQQILINSGVLEDNIEVAEICTYSNPGLFYSARRDGVKTGRLATGIMLKDKL